MNHYSYNSLKQPCSHRWRGKWQPTPVFLPGEPCGQGSLPSCCPWGHTESDTTEATQQQPLSSHFFFFFNWPPPSPGLTSVDLASPFIPGTKKLSLHLPGLSRPPLTSHFCSPVRFQSGPLSNTSIVLLSFLCARLCHLGEGIHGVGKSRLLKIGRAHV